MKRLDLAGATGLQVPTEVLRELEQRAARLGADMVVIGAAARDLVVHAAVGEEPVRATLDVDVAIAVDDAGFAGFTQGLELIRRTGHRFRVLRVEVDVVPFGPVETNRHVLLRDGHRLDVTGLAEAAATAVQVEMPCGLTLKVASLPAQAALKVLAWRDRHMRNTKDALDLEQILECAALGPYADEVWEDESALEHEDYDLRRASAFRAGKLSAAPFASADGAAVLEVLEDPVGALRLAQHMRSLVAEELIGAFARGFREGLRDS